MLLKWIKTFFSSEPDYIKNSNKSKRKPTMEHGVKYVYSPSSKGEFRFPLIPDDDPKKVQLSKIRDEVPKHKINPFKEKRLVEEEPTTYEYYKPPFVARNIPSPTHGYLKKGTALHKKRLETAKVAAEAELFHKVIIENSEIKQIEQKTNVVTMKKEIVEIPLFQANEDANEQQNEVTSEQTIVVTSEQQPDIQYTISNEIEEDDLDAVEEVTAVIESSSHQSIAEVPVREEDIEDIDEMVESFDRMPIAATFKEPEPEPEPVINSPNKGAFPKKKGNYVHPSLQMLNLPFIETEDDNTWIDEQKELLEKALNDFQVKAEVVDMQQGPSITRFEVQPAPGVKVNKITNLSDDLKLSLAAKDIRIQAPIPGKNSVGIEIPNRKSRPVLLKEVLQSPEFQSSKSPLTVALGMDISGTPVVTDLKKMPHGLIAGATGSGKSVCINTMLMSLLYKSSPEEVKLLLVDPKMVELTPYNDLPHLVSPVITDAKAATKALKWAVQEMEDRYQKFVKMKVRDIERYNEKSEEIMPYIVIVIDELADLMMVAPGDVEDAICRIAQKARACGIHLLLATQRPSVDVITGLIKANIPTRIAFAVSSQTDSRTILDEGGAEKLLGKGDMLFSGNGAKLVRLQGNFVSDEEIETVTEFVKQQQEPDFMFEEEELISPETSMEAEDELFLEACEFVIEQGSASSSGLQRKFRMGYNRAARLIDIMEEKGIVSAQNGSKPREILISMEEFFEMI